MHNFLGSKLIRQGSKLAGPYSQLPLPQANICWQDQKLTLGVVFQFQCSCLARKHQTRVDHHILLLYKKTACKDKIKFINDHYSQMYKTLQLFTSLITSKTNIFTSIKAIENACTHIYADTKVIQNAMLVKVWVQLKLFSVLGLMK